MKAGYSRLTVTAPIGTIINGYGKARISDGILDDITVTAVAFSDGERTAVAITMDILEMVRSDADRLRGMIAEKHGVDPEAILLHCIHAHTTPEISGVMFQKDEAYVDFFFKRVTDAAGFAIADLKDAKPYIAIGEAKGLAFVRRYILKDGSLISFPWKDEEREKVDFVDGTPDNNVQLVKLVREGAHDIAIVNFQMHPDGISGTKFSADHIHFARMTLEQALVDEADGKGVKVAYFNGAQGDTGGSNPDPAKYHRGYTHVRNIGRNIAAAVLRVYTYAEPVADDRVFFGQSEVHIPKGSEKDKDRDVLVSCVGFGEVGFIGLPGEPFTEVGRKIKAGSAFKMTIPTCNTNDWMGYIPMRESFKYGGYGVSPNRNPGAADLIINTALKLTNELADKE